MPLTELAVTVCVPDEAVLEPPLPPQPLSWKKAKAAAAAKAVRTDDRYMKFPDVLIIGVVCFCRPIMPMSAPLSGFIVVLCSQTERIRLFAVAKLKTINGIFAGRL
ncbi:hypothetical protein [Paraburkholderia sp. BL21I4N1]|uniref:hypothetical protein n=1 Tax=Paraburkholderia sp. BL21I4N1 TaxID=1938801 RepID=UPI002157C23E|nr:hypothetical protein [Paraburkholderia sp. BL21I4N1]